ncbi:DUF3488 and DUF4129 domain-containing transglutaminase family protein [Rhodopirellula sp. MGV]|uniref:transglutaminase TgpA family protein n=1 Tax=Rhodopirellula sp. MGV TaxID=2023130 RepID=UPI000B96DF0C|nr:transglutaminaseTgpA domain-containing protein [Rhodopirellula sp. MGV]OYP36996.1 hypothetical protein CGZ80_06475 [Rhodopirellula sp. MGV]PNY36241.1 DUF3488 domain-containing protein [Rhodopirellula baltica]
MNGDTSTAPLRRNSKAPFSSLPSARTKLYFYYALLSAAGGVVLGIGQDADEIAVLAVFFAVFGFLFVDYLSLIALPQLLGYIAMGLSAAYCIQDFWLLEQRGQTQMVSVALLLVLVQGILMMQRKSRRILEQLAVFCLLELVVAAIFNDAIGFGVMVLPISIIGASALCLLGVVTIAENLESNLPLRPAAEPKTRLARVLRRIAEYVRKPSTPNSRVTIQSPSTAAIVDESAVRWAKVPLLVSTPAICLVMLTFFYLLPRRIVPTRSSLSGPAMVGFDDEIRLEQLGQVMQNSARALKVQLTNADTGAPYELQHGLYLRGKVLERYDVDYSRGQPIAKWVSSTSPPRVLSRLPAGYVPADRAQRLRYDKVEVEITCESMSRPALFAVAPYYSDELNPEILHAVDRWTLTRDTDSPPFPALTYRFFTNSFYKGVQAELTPRPIRTSTTYNRSGLPYSFGNAERDDYYSREFRQYQRQLLTFDRDRLPSAERLAEQILETIPDQERVASRIAKEFAYYLATDPQFQYTLDLSAKVLPNVDPIEQFLATDRRGHCQYFASALALMLRSVGIPSRVIVGYRSDEFNKIGGYYIARQQHAHAWVEALVEGKEFPQAAIPAGSKPSRWYWLRLDPTPAASLFQQQQDRQGAQGLMNLANNIWEDYVVDMNRNRQNDAIQQAAQYQQMKSTYDTFWRQMKQNMSQLSSQRSDKRFSLDRRYLVAILLAVCVAMAIYVVSKISIPSFGFPFRRRRKHRAKEISIPFYGEAIRLLRRTGIERDDFETPDEFAKRVGVHYPPLKVLTDAFNDCRYGGQRVEASDEIAEALTDLKRLLASPSK